MIEELHFTQIPAAWLEGGGGSVHTTNLKRANRLYGAREQWEAVRKYHYEIKQEHKDKMGTKLDAIRLMNRDINALCWIADQEVIRIDHLQVLLGLGAKQSTNLKKARKEGQPLGERNTRRVIQRWRELGLIEMHKVLGDEPCFLWLTQPGLDEVGKSYRAKRPSVATLRHSHSVNAVRLKLESDPKHKGKLIEWVSERRLKSEWCRVDDEDKRDKHTVDGVIIYNHNGQELKIAVEVELNRKTEKDLKSIITTLESEYDVIWYFCNERARSYTQRVLGERQKVRYYPI